MKKSIFLSALMLFSIISASAQDNELTLNAQLRPRAEYRNGALSPRNDGDLPAQFINSRARLSALYKHDALSVGFSAQNVGVWGQDPQVETSGRMMLNEAWANLAFGKGFFLKLGRQTLSYDDDRILGSLDWNVSGRSHDAAKLGYESKTDKLHLIMAFNQNSEKVIGGDYYASGGQPYKQMQTLWYQHIGSKAFNASFLLMNLGFEAGESSNPNTKYLQTLGTNITWKPGDFQLYGTFYYQTGKTVADKSVAAWMGALNASYQVTPAVKLTAATDYLSGDDTGDKYTAFNPLYGTHHKFYGTMDYFYASSFINGLNPGLWDNQLGAAFKTSSKVSLLLNYHYFLTATDVYSGDVKQARGLGSEIDFQLNWAVMPDVNLSAGYSTMLCSDAMKAVKGGDPKAWQDWCWVSLNITPKIFSSKW
ncbi:MAG: alginate export family protein [Dysgonamonadaceae bacterium]|jgi:hypothetical protein|nr:alginate export family protein [Dysgonamonadaceae bacterium]